MGKRSPSHSRSDSRHKKSKKDKDRKKKDRRDKKIKKDKKDKSRNNRGRSNSSELRDFLGHSSAKHEIVQNVLPTTASDAFANFGFGTMLDRVPDIELNSEPIKIVGSFSEARLVDDAKP